MFSIASTSFSSVFFPETQVSGFTVNSSSSMMIVEKTRSARWDYLKVCFCENSKEKDCLRRVYFIMSMSKSSEDSRHLSSYWEEEARLAGLEIDDCIIRSGQIEMRTDQEVRSEAKRICSNCNKSIRRFVYAVMCYQNYGSFADYMDKNISDDLLEDMLFAELKHRSLFGYPYIHR